MSTSTNKGSQSIQFQYGDSLTGDEFGRRNYKIIPVGVYYGGFLEKINDTSVSVKVWVCNISDGTYQVSARSTSDYTLSGVSSTNRNIVLRWTYNTQSNWYVDITAVSDGSVQTNDVILGRAIYSGSSLTAFDYTLRTVPNDLSHFLKVVPTISASMRVNIIGGWCTYGSTRLFVAPQSTSSLVAPTTNPRIDLVYVDIDGSVKVETGTEAASPSAPDFRGRVVLAQLSMTVGMTSITETVITDVRNILQGNSEPVGRIAMTGRSTATPGWLLCDGSAVSRTTYAALFAAIGTSFGSGNGSTTFNLPDGKHRSPIGYDASDSDYNAIGKLFGAKTIDTRHTHVVSGNTGPAPDQGARYDGSSSPLSVPGHAHTVSITSEVGGSSAQNNVHPVFVVNYEIKY